MSEQLDGGTLSIGLIDTKREYLFSPNRIDPELFVTSYPNPNAPSNSPEDEAKAYLQATILDATGRGLVGKSDLALLPTNDRRDKGYLLREVTPITPAEYGLATYNLDELKRFLCYLERTKPSDTRNHFLRLIIRHML